MEFAIGSEMVIQERLDRVSTLVVGAVPEHVEPTFRQPFGPNVGAVAQNGVSGSNSGLVLSGYLDEWG